MKGEIKMSKKEINRISILEKAVNFKMTNQEGADALGITKRQFRTVKSRYREEGAQGIVHKSRGKPSNRSISQELKTYAINVVKERYRDFGPTLAHEKLVEKHGIGFSVETLRQEMIKEGVWKLKTKKKMNTHPLRERRECEGELVQTDGSPHDWFEGRAPECDLLVYMDDATGKLLWLKFVESESTRSYFEATQEYLERHGRPLSFYVDKHSVFRVNTTKVCSASTKESNGETQFGRAMSELDIELIFANSAQAKGRVERANQTLQDRLVKEMRLLGINSMEEGNKYLPEFMEKFNKRFAVVPKDKLNVHRPILKEQNLGEILCFKETRVISKNLAIQYKNKMYQINLEPGYEYTMRRAKVTVIEKINGEIRVEYRGKRLDCSVIKVTKPAEVYSSKLVNKKVDEIKRKKGFQLQFNLGHSSPVDHDKMEIWETESYIQHN